VFAASDANVGILSRIQSGFPEAFRGAFSSVPLFGDSLHHPLTARNLILWLLPVQTVSDLIYPFWLMVSSLTLIAYLRLWKCGWLSSLFGALVAFWVGSITLTSSGHINKPAVAAFFVMSLFFFEKSLRAENARRSLGYALLCGGATGFMLLEQQDVGLYFAVLLGPYMLLRLVQCAGTKWKVWLRLLLPIGVTALLISVAPALQAYGKNVADVDDGKQNAAEKWDFITQWSFPPAEWPDLIAPGYTGWSTGNPDGPYWGVMGQSAEWKTTGQGFQNFRLDSLYIGALPLLLALFGWAVSAGRLKGRDETAAIMFFWGVALLAAFWLSLGKFSPLYRLFYHLPLINNVRAPVKFMHNLQIMAGILSAFGLHQLLEAKEDLKQKPLFKWVFGVAGVLAVLMLAAAMSPSISLRFVAWGQYSAVIAGHVRRAWVHGALMALLASAGFFLLVWKRAALFLKLIPALFIAAVIFDSLFLTSHYFHSDDFYNLRRGNPVINYLKEHQEDGRVFLFSTDGVYNQWLASDFSYHQINAFNVWQMPRMSADYRQFLSTVGRDWKKMIDLASVNYALAPAGVWAQIQKMPEMSGDFEPVMAYRFALSGERILVQQIPQVTQPGDQILLKVKSSLPRLALFSDWEFVDTHVVCDRLMALDFDPHSKVIVSTPQFPDGKTVPRSGVFQTLEKTEITPHGAEAQVISETGGVVIFTQHIGPGWSVFVDDEPTELLRCNDLSMGVFVQAGEHTVRFECPRDGLGVTTQIAGMLLVLGSLILIPAYKK